MQAVHECIPLNALLAMHDKRMAHVLVVAVEHSAALVKECEVCDDVERHLSCCRALLSTDMDRSPRLGLFCAPDCGDCRNRTDGADAQELVGARCLSRCVNEFISRTFPD